MSNSFDAAPPAPDAAGRGRSHGRFEVVARALYAFAANPAILFYGWRARRADSVARSPGRPSNGSWARFDTVDPQTDMPCSGGAEQPAAGAAAPVDIDSSWQTDPGQSFHPGNYFHED